MGYKSVCKIHSKKRTYREDGDQLRNGLFDGLLGSKQTVTSIMNAFSVDESLGMVILQNSLLKHNDNNMFNNHERIGFASNKIGVPVGNDIFPAGSMFWFRPDALFPLLRMAPEDFDMELGFSDGTTAHAIERIFATVTKQTGYRVKATLNGSVIGI